MQQLAQAPAVSDLVVVIVSRGISPKELEAVAIRKRNARCLAGCLEAYEMFGGRFREVPPCQRAELDLSSGFKATDHELSLTSQFSRWVPLRAVRRCFAGTRR